MMTEDTVKPPKQSRVAADCPNERIVRRDLRKLFTENAEQFDALVVEMLAENDRLRALLAEAADCVQDWGAYASGYFQEKYDLDGTIKRLREAAYI